MQRSSRTFATNLSDWYVHIVLRIKQHARELLRKPRVRPFLRSRTVHEVLWLAGILAGAAAFALWLSSSAAGLFAVILLFLLATIGKSLERIAAGMRTQPAARLSPSASDVQTTDQRNIFISAKAMERLRPWVEEERPLSEESAKAYCSVLLDTLAMLHPTLSGRAHAEDKWS